MAVVVDKCISSGNGCCCCCKQWWVIVVVGVEVESGSIPKLQMKFGAEKSAMFGCFETFFDNAYNPLAIRTSSLTVDLLLLSCQIVMLATAAVPPVQAEDITT